LSQKALVIAVGIAISLTITSSILFTLNQITLIYQDVYTTDVSIKNQFSEFAMYQGTEMLGIDMYNTAKKYKDNPMVNVTSGLFNASNIKNWINNYSDTDANYNKRLYDVSYTTDNNGIVTILFKGKWV